MKYHIIIALALALLFCCIHNSEAQNKPVDADVLLENGLLYLGDGQQPQTGSVAIAGEKIVAVGQFQVGQVKVRVDCTGLSVSPGFIDLHNHSDRGVLKPETRSAMNYLTQGCTTMVTGNCGSGPTDVGDYYRKLDEYGIGVNVAHLIPQGTLRGEIIGDEQRQATPEDLNKMREVVAQGMRDGAWGMSTGLIYVPSSFADTDELVELAKVVGTYNGLYASHIRGEGTGLLESVAEALDIGRRGELPVHISHFKSSGKDSWGLVRTAVEVIKKAREKGQVVTADQYPYTASSTSLGATTMPSWARAGGRERTLERLKSDTEDADRIRKAIERKLQLTDHGHRIQIARFLPRPDWAGLRLDEIAQQEQLTPFELVMHIESNGGASIVNHSINEEDVRYVMTLPWVATASDGSARLPSDEVPHPRSYGTFPRKIGYYSIQEKNIPVEHAVRSSTGLPADILGMTDRGYLKTVYFADVVIWNEKDFIDTATFTKPHQYSEGLVHVYVNGTPAMLNGRVTGALAGRALRKSTSPSE
ncbi:MAG: amidohydrolase family protein [Planctomycetaceae bacterium]|nr:amidohydrolase family protein [Planctomycetaceae bacterium]